MPRATTELSTVRNVRFPVRDWQRMQRAVKRMKSASAENRDVTEADFIRLAMRELTDKWLEEKAAEAVA